ncbi:uncharacterized protein MAM_04481 [Metarhizium album ARSEF 1941]|uniref:Uncharacterized protein n=1 Tax=Metarhizium album (strain ARSEF 1941) TaxID=1081103 RepID=A0A0B2WN23_METAS|nr:uncharacterized protein MAM_04481 [Metarhizium album ARSEF 1941]KHN97466.1 hypothetical protein MAM_04481 [Metarhizium album ARSEF 1941]
MLLQKHLQGAKSIRITQVELEPRPAVTAFKYDKNPMLETIFAVAVLGCLWNCGFVVQATRTVLSNLGKVSDGMDILLTVLWVASVPGMVTSYVYSKDNFTISKGKKFDHVRVAAMWSTVLGFLPQFYIVMHSATRWSCIGGRTNYVV